MVQTHMIFTCCSDQRFSLQTVFTGDQSVSCHMTLHSVHHYQAPQPLIHTEEVKGHSESCDASSLQVRCSPGVLRSSVQRFLFDPDRGAGDGLAMPQVTTQDVLAELGRVDPPAAGRLDAEAFLEQTLQDLRVRDVQVNSGEKTDTFKGAVQHLSSERFLISQTQ